MSLPQPVKFITPEEYLRIERAAEFKSEYFAGEMFAMAGGSPEHSLLKTNIVGELRSQLKGRPCTVYDSDLRVWTGKAVDRAVVPQCRTPPGSPGAFCIATVFLLKCMKWPPPQGN